MQKLSVTVLIACFLWGGALMAQSNETNTEKKKTKKLDAKVYKIKTTPKQKKLKGKNLHKLKIKPVKLPKDKRKQLKKKKKSPKSTDPKKKNGSSEKSKE